MTKLKILMLLPIFLVAGAAWAVEEDDQNRTLIKLDSDDTGESLSIDLVDWSVCIVEQIHAVNDSLGEFCVDIYNGPTEQDVVNWMELQNQTDILDYHYLDMVFDAALNVARMQNVVRLMTDMGVERHAYRYVPLRDDEEPFIEIYFEEYPQSTTHVSHTDTLYIAHSSKSLLVGVEATAVSDGKPVIVPTFSLELPGKNNLLTLTGGYWPTGDTDQKFFAGSGSFFRDGDNLGLMIRIVYASESVETYGSYIQQGFGPMVGLVWRDENFRAHLTVGIQYFDRFNQGRRIEPSINLGVKLNALTF